jgi:hypothetical protein
MQIAAMRWNYQQQNQMPLFFYNSSVHLNACPKLLDLLHRAEE